MTTNLAAIGWDKSRAAGYEPFAHPTRVPGRVVHTELGVCAVTTTSGTVRASVAGNALAEAAGDLSRLPCVGDWVVLRSWSDRRVTIELVLPRTTTLSGLPRRFTDGDLAGRALAANVDVVAVLEPLGSGPDLGRIDRLLTIVRRSGAEPQLVLTKGDLVAESDLPEISEMVAAVAAGAPVHVVSARTDRLASVRDLAGPGRTLAILGPPASGRSSLVNALTGATVSSSWGTRRGAAAVTNGKTGTRSATDAGQVAAAVTNGKTGTRSAGGPILVALPFGGAVIDLPLLPGPAVLDVPGLWTRKLS
jgi:ribosome biogenesis GTPase